MSTIKSSQVAHSTVADTWRWLWPDVLMRIIPLGVIPFLYIAIFHLPLAFLGLTLHNWPQQLVIGLVVGVLMTCFASAYRMYVVGPFFRRPTPGDPLLPAYQWPGRRVIFSGLSVGCCYTVDRLDWLGMAGEHCHLHTLPSPGKMELAKCRWSGIGWPGIQFSVSCTAGTSLAFGSYHCARLHDLGFS